MKIILSAIAAAIVVVGIGAAVHAEPQQFHAADNLSVAKGDVIDGAYYAGGNTVTIAGTVKGDVYCAGQTVTIEGTIEGDVYCAGQTITIGGVITGDVRIAGQQVAVDGAINGSLTLLGQTASVSKTASIGRDLNGLTQTLKLSGTIGRDLTVSAEQMTIEGAIGRTVTSDVKALTISEGASIKDSLYYTSANDASIAKGSVIGATKRSDPPRDESGSAGQFMPIMAFYLFFSLRLIAVVLVLVMPRVIHAVTENGIHHLGMSILVGFFVLFGVPIIIVMIAATAIGLPLAGLMLLVWLLIVVLSGPMFGYYLGRLIMRDATKLPIVYMLMGTAILLICYIVPFIGIIAMFVAGVVGSGMIVLELTRRNKQPEVAESKVVK